MIEIPLIIVKGSFESRKRNYKCNICKKVIDRLFQYEDHWLGHLIGGGGALGNENGDGGQPDSGGVGDANGNKHYVPSVPKSNCMFSSMCKTLEMFSLSYGPRDIVMQKLFGHVT